MNLPGFNMTELELLKAVALVGTQSLYNEISGLGGDAAPNTVIVETSTMNEGLATETDLEDALAQGVL